MYKRKSRGPRASARSRWNGYLSISAVRPVKKVWIQHVGTVQVSGTRKGEIKVFIKDGIQDNTLCEQNRCKVVPMVV